MVARANEVVLAWTDNTAAASRVHGMIFSPDEF